MRLLMRKTKKMKKKIHWTLLCATTSFYPPKASNISIVQCGDFYVIKIVSFANSQNKRASLTW